MPTSTEQLSRSRFWAPSTIGHRFLLPVFLGMLVVACHQVPPEAAMERTAPLLEGMGNLNHPVTTDNALAQRFFDQGLTLAFGFNHWEAERSFREAARLDPDCAMAYWGIALVLGPNINAAMEDEAVPKAYRAIQQALELAPRASAKEQAYIQALAKRYAPESVVDRKPLDSAYAEAMGEVAKRYPDDADATALYAEALMDLHPWDYWEADGRPKPWTPKILRVLESGLQRWPEHPGLNHFYIHAVEASAHPERALPSADRLLHLVPGIGHLVHMPGHIYIRTGRYADVVTANELAIEADKRYLNQSRAQGLYPIGYVPHNQHFLSAAAAMAGMSEKALSAARQLASRQDPALMREPGYGTLQHYFMIPLYAMVRFGQWDPILREPAPESDLLYPTGVWHFARGMAYARSGQLDRADRSLAQLRKIAADTDLRQITIWEINTTYDLLQIATDVLAGEIAAKRGSYGEAVDHLRNAVRLEDRLTYDEPPPWYFPARHNLGAVLLEADRAAEAETVYREDLAKYPENGWSLYGLHLSLAKQGKTQEAEAVKRRFAKAWAQADVRLTASRF